MSNDARPVRSSPGAFRWMLAAALAGPATIVLHELGHYVVGRLAGRTDLVLHHASVGRLAGVTDHAALLTGGGVAVSWALVLLCTWRAVRRPAPLVVATGCAAALKSVPCPLFFLAWLAGNDGADSRLDEVVLSRELGLPIGVGTGIGSVVLLGGIAWLLTRIDLDERRRATIGLALGFLVGIPAWLFVVGPVLIP